MQLPEERSALEIIRFAVAPQHFQQLVYLGDAYRPEEAVKKGFVDEVVPSDDLMDRSMTVAERLAAIPADTFEMIKKLLAETFGTSSPAKKDPQA